MTTSTATLTPLQTIQAVYEAFGRGDLEALLSYVHPDVEWCQATGGADHPVLEVGRGIGHDAVRNYFGAVAEHFAITRFIPMQMAANDEGYVFTLLDLEFADPAVGKTVAMHEIHVFRVVDGKITFYEPVIDTAKSAVAFTK